MKKGSLYRKLLLLAAMLFLILMGAGLTVVMQPVPIRLDLATPPQVSPADLERHVRMLAETFHPRSYDQTANIDATASYIEACLNDAGARVHSEEFTVPEGTFRNIIGEYGPENGPVLIVGAHYDSNREKLKEGLLHTPGADDNASGVAGLLALGSLLKAQPPNVRVVLAAYPLEEPPFYDTDRMGSAVHASLVKESKDEIIGMICLEMIGYFSDDPGSQEYPVKPLAWLYPDTGNYIAIVGRLQDISLTRSVKRAMKAVSDLPVYSMNALAQIEGVDYSDHRNYWRHGYTAVMITDTAFYRNKNYHMGSDTPDTLDYLRMSKVVQGVFSSVHYIAAEYQ